MKKNRIITVVLVIVAFIVGFFVGDNSAVNRINKLDNNKQLTQQTNSTPTESQENKTKSKVCKKGEESSCGDFNLKILDANETTTVEAGNKSDNKTTNEKFIVCKVSIKNISKQPKQYKSTDFILGNMKDKAQYTINDAAFSAMSSANGKETIYNKNNNFVGVYKDINPNTTKQTYLIFEVPKDFNISDGVLISGGSGKTTAFYLK
ncbi:DUF4352 domain-containing protein [Clostridium novyi]|uniref:DUF4352 domain-containing protein n=1 Tax=Clostridium novyi TaxID=1542 RepID=UPI0004D87996|nr:DUF4352 domain-containing protein [Clostridium novyi]KEH84602.1 hypothetical protein Z966_p0057 [Clostridium novyi A str. NCTC 538]KEH84678.1 hypothetical protein Z967_p0060 [Clostridium novyi A str. 4540]KEH84753.1 hypothetical protein Z965_p0057 [Clostridium novyi A str. BKT29909]